MRASLDKPLSAGIHRRGSKLPQLPKNIITMYLQAAASIPQHACRQTDFILNIYLIFIVLYLLYVPKEFSKS